MEAVALRAKGGAGRIGGICAIGITIKATPTHLAFIVLQTVHAALNLALHIGIEFQAGAHVGHIASVAHVAQAGRYTQLAIEEWGVILETHSSTIFLSVVACHAFPTIVVLDTILTIGYIAHIVLLREITHTESSNIKVVGHTCSTPNWQLGIQTRDEVLQHWAIFHVLGICSRGFSYLDTSCSNDVGIGILNRLYLISWVTLSTNLGHFSTGLTELHVASVGLPHAQIVPQLIQTHAAWTGGRVTAFGTITYIAGQLLTISIHQLVSLQTSWTGIFWTTLGASIWPPTAGEGWGLHTGIINIDQVPTLAHPAHILIEPYRTPILKGDIWCTIVISSVFKDLDIVAKLANLANIFLSAVAAIGGWTGSISTYTFSLVANVEAICTFVAIVGGEAALAVVDSALD